MWWFVLVHLTFHRKDTILDMFVPWIVLIFSQNLLELHKSLSVTTQTPDRSSLSIMVCFAVLAAAYCTNGISKITVTPKIITPVPLFTKRTDVLQPNLVNTRSREMGCHNDHIALKFGSHLSNAAADVPVKFQSDCKSQNPNLAAWRLHNILRQKVRPLSE